MFKLIFNSVCLFVCPSVYLLCSLIVFLLLWCSLSSSVVGCMHGEYRLSNNNFKMKVLSRHVVCQEHYCVCTIAAVSEVKYSSEDHRMQRSTTSSSTETRSKSHTTSPFNTSTTPLQGIDDACTVYVR